MPDGGVEEAVKQVAAPVAQQAAQSLPMNLLLVLMLALGFVFLVEFVRALPWTPKALAAKPLTCDACVVGWLAIGTGIWLGYTSGSPLWAVLHVLPAAGGALLGLALRGWMKSKTTVELTPP